MGKLEGKKVAILAADGVEQVELTEPRKAVENEGADVTLLSVEAGEFQGFNHLDKADTFTADRAVKDVSPEDFDGLLLPGGVANPDFLRTDDDAVRFVRDFFASGKPIGVICHGPWTLVEAGVLRGRRITSWPSLKTDIRNAGGDWVDEEVVVDDGLVSSRKPDDLPAFCAKVVEELWGGGPPTPGTSAPPPSAQVPVRLEGIQAHMGQCDACLDPSGQARSALAWSRCP